MNLWKFAKEALLHATPATVATHERAASSPPPSPVATVASVACSRGADSDQPTTHDGAALVRRAQFKERAATIIAGAGISASSGITRSTVCDSTRFTAGNITGSASITTSTDITSSTAAAASTPITGSGATTGSTDSSTALLRPTRSWDSEDWLAFYGEKAGIGEHDHGMTRRDAEAHAVEHCISEWLYQHPMSSDADDGCLVCNEPDRAGDDLLLVGLGGGEVWLHRGCSTTWRTARIAAAVTALVALGIAGPEGSS
jgi:hypothetical protein